MEPIAIIGLSFKLPRGIEDTSSFWDTLENGKNVMTPWPEDRTSITGFYEADTSKINRVRSSTATKLYTAVLTSLLNIASFDGRPLH